MEPHQENTHAQTSQSQAEQTAAPTSAIPNEIKDQRAFAILGYIFPILFFLPLLNEKTKNSPYARFHANQQLILLLVFVSVQFVLSYMIRMFMYLLFLMDLVYLGLFALVVYGAYYAYKGNMKELPLIGHFRIL